MIRIARYLNIACMLRRLPRLLDHCYRCIFWEEVFCFHCEILQKSWFMSKAKILKFCGHMYLYIYILPQPFTYPLLCMRARGSKYVLKQNRQKYQIIYNIYCVGEKGYSLVYGVSLNVIKQTLGIEPGVSNSSTIFFILSKRVSIFRSMMISKFYKHIA